MGLSFSFTPIPRYEVGDCDYCGQRKQLWTRFERSDGQTAVACTPCSEKGGHDKLMKQFPQRGAGADEKGAE
jgi:hypothetical protein